MVEVRLLPVESIVGAEYNPRKALSPKSPAYQKLRAGLQEFGLVEPLVWNEATERLVGGHARLKILRELGVQQVPVSVVRLSEAREKALNVLLNNQEAQGRYDPAKLATILKELEQLPEFALTGFDSGTLRDLELEALPDVSEAEPRQQVELLLRFDEATYEATQAELSEWIAQRGIEVHIRRI